MCSLQPMTVPLCEPAESGRNGGHCKKKKKKMKCEPDKACSKFRVNISLTLPAEAGAEYSHVGMACLLLDSNMGC